MQTRLMSDAFREVYYFALMSSNVYKAIMCLIY